MKKFPFSNFARMDGPIFFNGLNFWTVENYFQAMKARNRQTQETIASVSPRQAKKLGRRTYLRSDWENVKIEVMRSGLLSKFARGTSWSKKLIAFKGPIVEFNTWHDNEWGDCVCGDCELIQGRNKLGKLLEQIREELRS